MISYRLVPLQQLPKANLDAWQRTANVDPRYSSPYFQPAFSRLVAGVRDDAYVILAEHEKELCGLLPIQMPKAGHAQPIGGKLNDLHGMLHLRPFRMDHQELLRQTRIKTFSFHSAMQSEDLVEQCQFETVISPCINLQTGFESYFKRVTRKSKTIRRQGQKTRKLISEVGPLRFEFHQIGQEWLERTLHHKLLRYRKTKTFDLFSLPWPTQLLSRIVETQLPSFAGVHSVLFAGDQMVASHVGIRSQNVLHYWFPTYDSRFKKYSPGIQLILEMCRCSRTHGIEKLDLGYGRQGFKYKLANEHYETSYGQFAGSRLQNSLSRRLHFAKKWMKESSLQPFAKNIIRTIHPRFGHRVFR